MRIKMRLMMVFNHAVLRKNIPPNMVKALVRRIASNCTQRGERELVVLRKSIAIVVIEALAP